jgi:hypothetical protein
MTPIRPTALAVLAALALGIAGCGDDEGAQIPRDQAAELIANLQETMRRAPDDRFVCGDLAQENLPQFDQQLAALPEDLDEDVRQTLEDGVGHLRGLIEDRCADQQREREQTQPEEPAPAPEETQPEETQPEETQPEETQPEETQPEEDGGGQDGGGGGSPPRPGPGGSPSPDTGGGGGVGPGDEERETPRRSRGGRDA